MIGESPALADLRREVRRWFADNLPPDWGTPDFVAPEGELATDRFLRDWQRTVYEGGWAGLSWPREYGGRGASPFEQAVFLEERDRVKPPQDIGVVSIGMVGPMLIQDGSAAQRARYLQPMLTGEEVWCQGFSEPDAGSDLAALRTSATRQGDVFLVNGQKVWTSRATTSDLMILLARTNPDVPKHKGITAFIVDMDSPGLDVRPIRQINGTTEFCEVFFTDVEVPLDAVVGDVDRGWQIALRTLAYERLATTRAFEARRLFRTLVDQLDASRRQDPVVAARLADLFCQAHAGALNYHRSVTRFARTGAPGPEESAGKLHTSELTQDITDAAMTLLPDVHRGRVREWNGGPIDWSLEYTNGLKNTIAAGTSQIQRNILGERVLGLPRGRS